MGFSKWHFLHFFVFAGILYLNQKKRDYAPSDSNMSESATDMGWVNNIKISIWSTYQCVAKWTGLVAHFQNQNSMMKIWRFPLLRGHLMGFWGNQNLTSFSQSEVVSSNKMGIAVALRVIFCKCNISEFLANMRVESRRNIENWWNQYQS